MGLSISRQQIPPQPRNLAAFSASYNMTKRPPTKISKKSTNDAQIGTQTGQNPIACQDAAKNGEKKKQIEETTAESQSIVVQDNSNPYNTSPKLSRLQMI